MTIHGDNATLDVAMMLDDMDDIDPNVALEVVNKCEAAGIKDKGKFKKLNHHEMLKLGITSLDTRMKVMWYIWRELHDADHDGRADGPMSVDDIMDQVWARQVCHFSALNALLFTARRNGCSLPRMLLPAVPWTGHGLLSQQQR